ncbi:hypothetical protein GGS21DRAFT_491234 [Xylaria nigripes]|nr:hypothetical protein GGS21DRAFT_492701 [Xylaria nigripes]KAI2632727.1 hypothetical protein GGS21DRAFT_491234 [Xylaria nigripes]
MASSTGADKGKRIADRSSSTGSSPVSSNNSDLDGDWIRDPERFLPCMKELITHHINVVAEQHDKVTEHHEEHYRQQIQALQELQSQSQKQTAEQLDLLRTIIKRYGFGTLIPPPNYDVEPLTKNASPEVVEEWIAHIKVTNKGLLQRPDYVLIDWALANASEDVRSDWISHLPTLRYDDPQKEVKLDDLWTFVRGHTPNPDLFTLSYYDQLEAIRQDKDESPLMFFRRWKALHRRVRVIKFKNKPALAHHYLYRLHANLQQALCKANVKLDDTAMIADQAQTIWNAWRDVPGLLAAASLKRPSAELDPQAEPNPKRRRGRQNTDLASDPPVPPEMHEDSGQDVDFSSDNDA